MRRYLFPLTALASTVMLAAGCSSVRDNPMPNTYGAVGSPTYSSAGTYDQAAAVQYGTVRSIQELQTSQRTSGAGALLGAVVGGVVGHQVGGGTGRDAATALGAVGGAVAGNAIERNRAAPSSSYYQIDVQMDNGDARSFDYMDLNGLRVGDRVRVQDGQLQRW